MPSFADISLAPKHISVVPAKYDENDRIFVDVDAQVHGVLGEVIISSVRDSSTGEPLMLTDIGTDEVKAEIQARQKRKHKSPSEGMRTLKMSASVERGMFG